MGFGGISIWQLLIILAIVLLLFGTKRLKSIGADLGNAIKGFRGALSDSENDSEKEEQPKKLEEVAAKRSAEGDQTAPGSAGGAAVGTAAPTGTATGREQEKA